MDDQLRYIWAQGLELIKQQLNESAFKTWFYGTEAVSMTTDVITISVPNEFTRNWISKHYLPLIKESISLVIGGPVNIELLITTSEATPLEAPTDSNYKKAEKKQALKSSEKPRPLHGDLNNNYSFETFVVGESNRFAQAAALAVAENPAQAYNPLFLCGGSGLGKTHLLHAIGNYSFMHYPHLKVRYVSTEKFINDFILSIGYGDARRSEHDGRKNFQQKYRKVDILLIDDIQFLEGKEQTQEAFFHTFNSLHGANKQIVISSDRPPREIATLEDRLRSRFEWGLLADIQPPKLETRIAILKKKAVQQGISADDSVFEYVASVIKTNIRELEGALIRVVAFSSLYNRPIDISLAQEILRAYDTNGHPKIIEIQKIQEEVCNYYKLSKEELLGPKRAHSIVYPRQIAMYLTRDLTDLSLPQIGESFGKRDHTTVIHACNKIQTLITEHQQAYQEIQYLTEKLKKS